jgi:hypothetical protein
MQSFRVETVVRDSGTLTLNGLPFTAGQVLEVTIIERPPTAPGANPYPLRGLQYQYADAFSPVADNDWQVMQ